MEVCNGSVQWKCAMKCAMMTTVFAYGNNLQSGVDIQCAAIVRGEQRTFRAAGV